MDELYHLEQTKKCFVVNFSYFTQFHLVMMTLDRYYYCMTLQETQQYLLVSMYNLKKNLYFVKHTQKKKITFVGF